MKSFKLYLQPKETKTCLLCGKEIDKKWKDDLCEACRIKLNLQPKKFKHILEIFKITNGDKSPQKSGEGKMTKKQPKAKETEEDKRTYINFFESEMADLRSNLDLSKDAKRGEISNAIRKKLDMPEKKTQRSGKKNALIKKLGLKEDATQADINEAVMELELE